MHGFADLRVMQKGLAMIDTPTGSSSLPLAMIHFLMPGLAEADSTGVDDPTDAHSTEPMAPIRKLHPMHTCKRT